MGEFSIWHWLIVLVIVAMVFGTKKLKNIGTDLGQAVKGFKDDMRDADLAANPPEQTAEAPRQRLVHERDGGASRDPQDTSVNAPH